jgi:lipoprotein-anchoring transpeptidase ErfK/SrfK
LLPILPSVRRLPFIAVTLVLLIVAGAGAAVLVLDHRADAKIAAGVRVGSIDVGGLTPAAARAKVHRELLAPLDGPVVVHHGDRQWRLTAAQARIHADVTGMVATAVARSRRGNALQRAWREATGGKVQTTVPARVSFSRSAVKALVARVEGALNTEPKDASLTFSAVSLTPIPGHTGVALNAAPLQSRIMHAIAKPGATRRFRATTHTVQPQVTTADLAERYPVALTVDRSHFKLLLWKNLKLAKAYSIAVGQVGLETPAGLYHIQNKAVDPAWNVPNSKWAGDKAGTVVPGGTPENPLKARWLGIFDGAGIHGIDPSEYGSIGHAASHGCVRMRIADVKDLYDQVPVQTPIYIA